MIRAATVFLSFLLLALPARADTFLQKCHWGPDLPPHTTIASGGIEGDYMLGIAGPTPPEGVQLITVDNSHLAMSDLAFEGSITPDANMGTVTLTMRAEFPDGKCSSSEVQFVPNPSAGTMLARDFRLPLHSNSPPSLVTFWVTMTGEGPIGFGPIELWDIAPPTRAWWDGRTGGWIGGIAGSCLGLVGAVIGILRSRSKALSLVSALILTSIAVGIVLLVAGIVALSLRQPYAVCYPLLLAGVLATAIFTPFFFHARRLRQQNELRKIRAWMSDPPDRQLGGESEAGPRARIIERSWLVLLSIHA